MEEWGFPSRPVSLVFPHKRHLIELTELVFEFEPKFVLITTLVFCKVDGHREVI